MIFSTREIEELLNIIDAYHVLFIGQNVGKELLTNNDINLLREHGISLDSITNLDLVNQSFKFGVLAEALGDQNTQSLNFSDFKKYIKEGKFIPLTKVEEKALEATKHQAYHDIKNLGSRIGKDFTQLHQIRSREEYEKLIEEEAAKAIINRKSAKDMAIELGKKTNDWGRDFGRISDYIMHSSFEEGKAAKIQDDGGEDALVYKDVFPGACRHCIKNYLTNGIGSRPRIFKLSVLRSHGTNIGRKAADWKPTLGPLHPWCRCTLQYLEEGWKWNTETKTFEEPEEFVRKVQRRSKIKYSIGDRQFEI